MNGSGRKMIMKVGILTLNGYDNYGNRLQNFALQKTIEKFGAYVETIRVTRSGKTKRTIGSIISALISITPIFTYLNRVFHRKIIQIRYEKFVQFTKKHINESAKSYSQRDFQNFDESRFDYFITGSDQVWNPDFLHGTDFYFLGFTSKKKRLTYAPSFGISKIPESMIESYRAWINGFDKLSVREQSGQEIIKELTGKPSEVLVDPTMLINDFEWMQIATPHANKPHTKYAVCSFLGRISFRDWRVITRICRRHELTIVRLGDMSRERYYDVDPAEFLDYIHDSSVVFTDSFHSTVFSILFHKPFVVYKRENMNSRIDTLLEKYNFSNRKSAFCNTDYDVFNIDYSTTNATLLREQVKAWRFIESQLHVSIVNNDENN